MIDKQTLARNKCIKLELMSEEIIIKIKIFP